MSAKAPALFEMISKATAADLERIDTEISAKQEVVDMHVAEVNRLKHLRKTINILVNGKPERKKSGSKKAAPPPSPAGQGGSVHERRKKIAQILAKESPLKPANLAEDLGTSQANVAYAVSCPLFAATPNGIVLTPEGRRELLES